jgi:hypothetical protein
LYYVENYKSFSAEDEIYLKEDDIPKKLALRSLNLFNLQTLEKLECIFNVLYSVAQSTPLPL